ncbi:MAG: Holliday junction branch migration protein RuvA [Candidatus Veblenbacteria bacterium]|nr:Holliday junction branch migration protein RuvA [Candidatus Veblenbacteria bacterium]MDZ4229697.1 Holliday junction branch migration protein RuvA [Candidatus Veblenbacteria bacterium]
MIAQLKGLVAYVTERSLVVDVGGVGYEVFVTRELAARQKVGSPVTLCTHLNVREDALELYGFVVAGDLSFFKLLLTVSGVGPKSALNILDAVSPDDVRRAVTAGDATTLHRLHGLGKKTAERLVTELKDKVEAVAGAPLATGDEGVVLEAITGLGYSLAEARQALKEVAGQGNGLAERIKLALKYLGRR